MTEKTILDRKTPPRIKDAVDFNLELKPCQRFTLDNGQIWQMTDLAEWSGPAYERPEVTIRPGALGTFWLRIPEAGVRVKVKPVKLE